MDSINFIFKYAFEKFKKLINNNTSECIKEWYKGSVSLWYMFGAIIVNTNLQ